MLGIEWSNARARVWWWGFVAALAAIAGFIAVNFVGLIALGVFGYYATRPINRQLERSIDSEEIAAWITVLLVVVPILLLVFYTGFRVIHELQQFLGGPASIPVVGEYLQVLSGAERETVLSTLRDPGQTFRNPEESIRRLLQTGRRVLSAVFGTLVLLALSLTLTYFLLAKDDGLAEGLLELIGGRDSTAYAYATAVDQDLESVFFGNLLFVAAMSVIAGVAYWGTNVLAPQGLHVPMVFVLAVLTGAASLIPLVVGKVIYVPVVGYLAYQATRTNETHLVFVGATLVVYFLLLDILPQTFLQPYITGRQLDMVVMMFAYLLGPILFGWYGFFLLPIFFVLMLEAVRIVLPELVRGEQLTPSATMGDSIGTNPGSAIETATDGEKAISEGNDAVVDDDQSADDDGSPADGQR